MAEEAPKEALTPRRPWASRRVLLGVTGGIAAYKTVQLARDLTRLGADVQVVMTPAARRFAAPTAYEAVTGRPVRTDLFEPRDVGTSTPHIALGRDSDVVVVAPATADFLSRAVQGRGDDLLALTLLVTRAPVLLCPAMNERMYAHPRVQANVRRLAEDGYEIVGPEEGPLAEGEGEGRGRMVEPADIVEYVGRALSPKDLAGRRVLVTAGPTREALDAVRCVGNRSSGRMGFALARAAWRRGARVILVSGPSVLADPPGVEVRRVESARDMLAAVQSHVPDADLVVFAAAVADYRPAEARPGKVKSDRQGDGWTLELVANPDIALETRGARKEGAVAVGFALETDDLLENARTKLREKGFDLIVANDATRPDSGFDVRTNAVTILSEGAEESLPAMDKALVADEILDRAVAVLEAS